MNPKQFLQIGGAVLVLVGVLGYVGVIGPTAEDSVFGEPWWFDNGENLAHTVLGLAALVAAFVLPAMAQRYLVIGVGVLGIAVAVYNIFTEELLGSNLETPLDLILHVVVGAWALFAAFNKRAVAAT